MSKRLAPPGCNSRTYSASASTSTNRNRAGSKRTTTEGEADRLNPSGAGPSRSAPLWLLAAAVLWGTTGTAAAFAPSGAHPITVGALRLLLAGPLLSALFGLPRTLPRAALLPSAVASAAIAIYQPAFFLGTRENGVAIGTLVALGSAPLFAATLEACLEGRRPSRRWLAATGLSIAGLAALLEPSMAVLVSPAGMLASLGAGSAYAVFVLAMRRCLGTGLSAERAVAFSFTVAAVLLAPALLWDVPHWVATRRGLLVVLYLGIVATALAYALFARGVAGTTAATVASLSLAEPLAATGLALFVLGETLTLFQAVGAVAVLAGLVLLAGSQRSPAPSDARGSIVAETAIGTERSEP
ncbi:MAG: EamA family transporter [Thermomicrobium sp.]|nr:EamA family transporter [Thermomicrobium sp.]